MKVKNGDIIEFIGVSWNNPYWEFGNPCMTISPVLSYSEEGEPDSMFEDIAISLCCGDDIKDENIDGDLEWCGTSIKAIKRMFNNRMKGKKDWSTKLRYLTIQKIKFIEDSTGDLTFQVLETKELN